MSLRFSVVINTYNRAGLLDDALSGLSALDHTDFEIIVINGPSTDNTDEVLYRWRDKVKLGFCAEPNLSMSRNAGIELAAGDVVCFIDDDAVAHPAWLTRLAVHYHDERMGAVGGFTVDNTGVKYQVRKTVCDRFGNAYFPSDFFDERPLCFPGTPLYPSLLGTNSSFRTSVLREIGGFDHAFAYLLDETDVCLRIVDLGYQVRYEPDAIVFHQFAPSHIRNEKRIAKTLYPSARSKAYFIHRHGQPFDAKQAQVEMSRYRDEILRANKWLFDNGDIDQNHRSSLDEDLLFGTSEGTRLATRAYSRQDPTSSRADLAHDFSPPPFLPMIRKSALRIVLVSKGFPPAQESGIARWTWMMAHGLAARGHVIHVVTLAAGAAFSRYQHGFWLHGIVEDLSEESARRASSLCVPAGLAAWCLSVDQAVRRLKAFGIDVVSFPIWDLEGVALLDHADIGLVMSLHTTYAMARPFKAEWLERPLFGHFHVDRVIAAEKVALASVPHILANSQAIIDDLQSAYSVEFNDRTVEAQHGTPDPWSKRPTSDMRERLQRLPSPAVITFVGRFEARKGFDIAVQVFVRLLDTAQDVKLQFVGDSVSSRTREVIKSLHGDRLLTDPRVTFLGQVGRASLDHIYINTDVVLMPSRYESFGLVAIEAFAAGAPVVALAVGGLKEVVEDGITGFLVPLDAHVLDEVLERLRRMLTDSNLLLRLKQQARTVFENKYTIERMVEAAEPVYFNACKVTHEH